MNYQTNAIAYMVNSKGQKVKPYYTPPPKKLTKIERLIAVLKNYF